MNVRRWSRRALTTVGALALAATVHAPVSAQETVGERLDDADSAVEQWSGRLNVLRSEYLRVQSLVREDDMSRALLDGRVRYQLQDYANAAIILERAVNNPSLRSHSGYAEAVYYLGDSYFMSRNFLRARRYFRQVLELPDRSYRLEAASRLIDIASVLDDYEGLDELYAELERTGDPAFAYQRGKALYFQERYGEAINAFLGINDGELRDRARYFVGVSQARLEDWEAAEGTFRDLLAVETLDEDLAALTNLAIGRIFYEQEQFVDALSFYGAVPRTSRRIDDALYEVAWTFIQLERYPEAVHQLEVMRLLADPQGRSYPEAQLLLGDVRMRMEEYDRAVSIFESVSNRYLPVERELDDFARRVRTADDFFAELVDPEDGSLLLPDLAQAWFQSDEDLERAFAASQDVESMREDLAMSRRVIAELDAALSPGSDVDIFPGLRDGWGQAIELENRSIRRWISLVELEGRLVAERLSAGDRQRYDQRRAEREALQQRFDSMPRTFAELTEREDAVIAEMTEVSVEAFRQQMEVQSAMSELDAMRRILRQQVRSGERSERSASEREDEIERMQRELRRRADEVDELLARIDVAMIEVSVADDVAASERELKRRLVSALEAESEALAPGRQSANGPWSRFDGVYGDLGRLQQDLSRFFEDMNVTLRQQTAEFRTALNAERANVERYEQELARREATTSRLLEEVAYDSVLEVRDRFGELSLRANLGIIDVAWREKEDLTDQIESLYEDQRQRLQVLEADFAEILDE